MKKKTCYVAGNLFKKHDAKKTCFQENKRIFCHLSEILWVINHKAGSTENESGIQKEERIVETFGNGFCEASCHDTVVTSHDGRNHCACNGRHAEIE